MFDNLFSAYVFERFCTVRLQLVESDWKLFYLCCLFKMIYLDLTLKKSFWSTIHNTSQTPEDRMSLCLELKIVKNSHALTIFNNYARFSDKLLGKNLILNNCVKR